MLARLRACTDQAPSGWRVRVQRPFLQPIWMASAIRRHERSASIAAFAAGPHDSTEDHFSESIPNSGRMKNAPQHEGFSFQILRVASTLRSPLCGGLLDSGDEEGRSNPEHHQAIGSLQRRKQPHAAVEDHVAIPEGSEGYAQKYIAVSKS